MGDFKSIQAQLDAARGTLQQAQVSATQAAARAQQAQSALAAAQRQASGEGDRQALEQLAAAAKKAAAQSDAAKAALGSSRAAVSSLTGQFAEFSDPRQNVSLLSASSPFLLFPVRIETRFRTIAAAPGNIAAGASHQLWVRIYPDDCSIDTFEPTLSQSELTSIKNYWAAIWSAGSIEDNERGAWAALVGAHGSGRAGWLADNFKPANPPPPPPPKAKASDEILVIPTSTALPPEADNISAYWKAVWLADGDKAKTETARTVLEGAVGAARAADLIASFVPFNLSDKPAPPLTKADVGLSTAFVVLPPDPDTTVHSWSQAPQVHEFPDRFVVLGYSNGTQTLEAISNAVTLPLYAGPDPSGDPTETIHPDPPPDGPDLFVPDELQWMVDFERAVAAGMGLAIDITPEQASTGFDRLLVIGLKLSTTAERGSSALQDLLAHHQWSRSGFSLLPQGTPTHNASGTSSGHGRDEDPDVSFADRKNQPLFTPVADPTQKSDGQWFAEFLALDPAYVATVHSSDGEDQKRARAMQSALWPATLGYWMNTLFTPTDAKASIFTDATIEQTRSFFTLYVSGRGPVPAIRIGGQPYGILPATAFSRIQWYDQQEFRGLFLPPAFLGNLYRILRQLDSDWTNMSKAAAWVGDNGDPHQTLLNVVAHHPSSVEYYSRTAESLQQIYNMLNFWAIGPDFIQALTQLGLQGGAISLLQRLGYSGSALPDLLNHFFLKDNPQIATVIDDRPLSETSGIRAYTDAGKNYIQWMIDVAASLETLRAESGFSDNKSPQALLYLFLRHAMMLGYYDASYNYHRNTGILSQEALLAMRTEPTFVHVDAAGTTSESRYAALYKTESRITGSPTLLVSQYIGEQIGTAAEAAVLSAQLDALKTLALASTAELERLFAEHIDTCSYRYDAWLLGLVNQRIAEQRAAAAAAANKQSAGIYLGAYTWVENLRPSTGPLVPAQVPPEVAKQFPGAMPLMVDAAGGGYIHGPSIQHANAAAVLRAGYLANATSGNPDTLAVNLSSDRVRVAMGLIEGIRNGQSLGALLGYRFERGLHDAYTTLAEVDRFIYPLRKAFPLAADALASTKTDPSVPIEAIEARNVLDGKKLVDRVRSSGIATYPYGLTTTLPATNNANEQDALNQQTSALLDAYDAVADLALAEGVFQAVQGNYDRVASTLEAYTTGNFPPEPQVVQTPPAGVTLTHRFAVQLKPGLPAPAGTTPRATAEPAVDEWLRRMLPPFTKLACTVVWNDPITGNPKSQPVTLSELGLRPLDVLYLLKPDNVQLMAELDDRILARVYTGANNPRPDATLQIRYMQAPTGKISLFEAGPLLRELRALVTQSRPLRANDVLRANDASQDDNASVSADSTRISGPAGDLKTLGDDIEPYLATLAPLLADTVAHRVQILNSVDANLNKAVGFLERAAKFAMPSSGWGFAYDWLRLAFTDLLSLVRALVDRWTQKLSDFNAAILAYDNLPPATSDGDRFTALQAAEMLISSQLDPLPATPANLRSALVGPGGKRDAFQGRLNQFSAVLGGTGTSFSALYNAVAALSVQEFDSQPFDINPIGDRAITVTEDISHILSGQLAAIRKRVDDVNRQLTAAGTAASASDQVAAIQAAAKLLLGADFQIVPEFTVSTAQGGEWANAVNASKSGDLFTYLRTTLKIDFPVDEWLYAAARVRPPLHSWEALVMLGSAFGAATPSLTPIQLPYQANAPWLASQFPDDYTVDSDRLLYTCSYSQAFNPNAHQCGLLLDEWAEVLPATTRDTGIAFNFNRPDNEPPQTMLLVTPASNNPQWQWADLVDALNETLDLAKKRAVEPIAVDQTVYSRFLPATVMAATTYAITISTLLTAANGSLELISGGNNA